MAKYGFIVYISAFIFAFTFQQANALKCWRCSSDASSAAFCDDPFTQDIISEQQRRWSYVDCSFPPSQVSPYSPSQTRPVCKKMKQYINDKVVVSRSCAWEDVNAPPNACMNANTPSYIRTEFCETCAYDGCNSASTYGPIAFTVLLSLLLAKLFA
uniref:Putative secreted protein n=1 Tax=Corethrella appendiculata TaxID=1370023 RepID=U5EDB7_9DIPT